MRLECKRLHYQDFDRAAQPTTSFCRLQKMPQQPASCVKGSSLRVVFTGSDEHACQRDMLELAHGAEVTIH